MAKARKLDSLLYLRTVRVRAKGVWKHDADSWCLFYVRNGKGLLQQGLEQTSVASGDVAILSADTQASFQSDRSKATTANTLHFDPSHLSGTHSLGARLLFCQAARNERVAAVVPKDTALARHLKALVDAQDSSNHPNGFAPIELMELVTPVITEFKEVLKTLQRGSGVAHDRVVSVLDNLPISDLYVLSVDELAQRCGCSRRHLSRLIKENCGCSLSTLRIQMRLDHAATKLHDPTAKIINIAMDCGFNHLGSFSARFRKRFGATPGEWRRQSLGVSPKPTLLVRLRLGNPGEAVHPGTPHAR